MFWALALKSNKRYTQTVKQSFHVSMASLETSSAQDGDVQLKLASDGEEYILCTLRKGTVPQCSLDLNFAEGDIISFFTTGKGSVHITGYVIPEPDDDDFMGPDSEDEDECCDDEHEAEPPTQMTKKAQKVMAALKKQMGVKVVDEAAADSDDDDDESADGEDDDDSVEGEDDEDDEAEADSDEDVEEEEEEEIEEPAPKLQKLDKKAKQQAAAVTNGQANGKPGKAEKVVKPEPKASAEKQLQGGLRSEDLKVGSGAEAKPGKKVAVFYEGRLKSNNKVFDSNKSGPGFKFALGRGEVIRGWDMGVAGMKVGGKRRLTIPPNLAYGAKGSPPVIPGNATLLFDVELRNVN